MYIQMTYILSAPSKIYIREHMSFCTYRYHLCIYHASTHAYNWHSVLKAREANTSEELIEMEKVYFITII